MSRPTFSPGSSDVICGACGFGVYAHECPALTLAGTHETQAGRRLFDTDEYHAATCASWDLRDYGCDCGLDGAIRAIEAEAKRLGGKR